MGFATPFSELTRKIVSGEELDAPTLPYKLIEENELQNGLSIIPAPGEFELLDSLNLMERGDYSGAVRRITTALEVIVESVVGKAVEAAEGKRSAVTFLKNTKNNFPRRVEKQKIMDGSYQLHLVRRCLQRARFDIGLSTRAIELVLMNGDAHRKPLMSGDGPSIGLRIIRNDPTSGRRR